jgi:hypothetical protein
MFTSYFTKDDQERLSAEDQVSSHVDSTESSGWQQHISEIRRVSWKGDQPSQTLSDQISKATQSGPHRLQGRLDDAHAKILQDRKGIAVEPGQLQVSITESFSMPTVDYKIWPDNHKVIVVITNFNIPDLGSLRPDMYLSKNIFILESILHFIGKYILLTSREG